MTTCRHCGADVPAARNGAERSFCSDAHRAAWKRKQRAAEMARAVELVDEMGEAVAEPVTDPEEAIRRIRELRASLRKRLVVVSSAYRNK